MVQNKERKPMGAKVIHSSSTDHRRDAAENERNEASARHSRELASMRLRGIPLLYAQCIAAGGLQVTPALKVSRNWLPDPCQPSLVISGPVGCGKSVALAWLVANGASTSMFVHVTGLIRAALHSPRDMELLVNASVLALDDLGTEYIDKNGMLLSVLGGLLEARSSCMLRTVIATNLPAAQFRERYQGRIVDRIRDGLFYQCNNKSLRGRDA